MGIAVMGGYICPSCGRRNLIREQSMYDHSLIHAYCTAVTVDEDVRGGRKTYSCGWHWHKDMGTQFPELTLKR